MIRATCQTRCDLTGYYKELSESEESITAGIGRMMLEILPNLDSALQNLSVWGLTSHYELMVLARDDYTSPWYVGIQAYPGEGYRVSYRMPDSEAPWQEARVHGIGTSAAGAADMVRIACTKSGGWK